MFGKLFKSKATPALVPLTRITIPTDRLLSKLKASPEAKALYQPGQSAGEFLQRLEVNHMPQESVNLLAHGLPEKDAVKWAVESARLVADKLNPADQKALRAAETWLVNRTAETRAAADEAALATNGSGPGGWAAQAAAWEKPSDPSTQTVAIPSAETESGDEDAPELAAAAVAGAVLLAAGLTDKPAMPDTPRPNAELAKAERSKPQSLHPPLTPGAAVPAMSAQGISAPAAAGVAPPAVALPGNPALPEAMIPGKPAVAKPAAPITNLPQGQIAKTTLPNAPQAPATPGVPHAEVPKLSPADARAFCKKLKPFLDLGKKIASGVS